MKLDRVVLATTNAKKITEMQRVFEGLPLQIAEVDIASAPAVDESGSTFVENATIKAVAQSRHFALPAIGEDSGLVVPKLGGEPGIYSARYAGKKSDYRGEVDAANNTKLLERMSSLTGADRDAYYVSSIALALPDGRILVAVEDRCHGRILTEPRGNGGFGYDPLFEIRELHQTFAELPPAVKAAISHRGRALRAFRRQLAAQVGVKAGE